MLPHHQSHTHATSINLLPLLISRAVVLLHSPPSRHRSQIQPRFNSSSSPILFHVSVTAFCNRCGGSSPQPANRQRQLLPPFVRLYAALRSRRPLVFCLYPCQLDVINGSEQRRAVPAGSARRARDHSNSALAVVLPWTSARQQCTQGRSRLAPACIRCSRKADFTHPAFLRRNPCLTHRQLPHAPEHPSPPSPRPRPCGCCLLGAPVFSLLPPPPPRQIQPSLPAPPTPMMHLPFSSLPVLLSSSAGSCSQPLGCMCHPHELFGHWHNDMSPVFWTRDLSFNWLGNGGEAFSRQRVVVYVYGGVMNRANAWLKSSAAPVDAATAAVPTLGNSTSHVAMSFESPDPLISRVFLWAAAQAAGAFDLFMCCDRQVLEALHEVMFMSCGWAEGSPPVEEWKFSAADKSLLVSMQVTEPDAPRNNHMNGAICVRRRRRRTSPRAIK